MNKKSITILIVVLVIIGAVLLGYIILNTTKKEDSEPTANIQEDNVEKENTGDIASADTNKGKNVVLNSKVGTPLVEKIKINIFYTESFAKYTNENGLSEQAKILYAFDSIITDDKYSKYRQSDELGAIYIKDVDLNIVIEEIFGEKTDFSKLPSEINYDKAKKTFSLVPSGFGGEFLEYSLDVPLEIKETNTHFYLTAYRVYNTRRTEREIGYNEISNDKIFSLQSRNVEVGTLPSSTEIDYTVLSQNVKSQIDSKKIDKTKLQKVEYVFKKSGEKIYIEEINANIK